VKVFRLIADALAGNTTLGMLSIGWNCICYYGMDDITRLVKSTRLQSIDFAAGTYSVFDNEYANDRFTTSLQKNGYVQELPGIQEVRVMLPKSYTTRFLAIVTDCLMRNKCLKHVALLLSTPPPTSSLRPLPQPAPPVQVQSTPQQQQQQPRCSNGSTTTTTATTTTTTAITRMKTCHKAIAHQFGNTPSQAGASAIFKLLPARLGVLECGRRRR
jgi:hypothetical protein